jgi:ketosteroid isomerase-like protein
MKDIALRLSAAIIIALFFALPNAISASGPADQSTSAACSAPEYRQFDFWSGDWDAFDTDNPNKVAARVRVERILDGCVLHEIYDGADGLHGESFSIYDAARKQWHQSWVTNRGQLLMVDGNFQNGEMVLSGKDTSKNSEIRVTWKKVEGGVREIATTTSAEKKTTPWFDMMFRPHQPNDDAKAIAALDTEYQAAVARNDAAAMDRLLADNFVLISSKGKAYSKADLLQEARSGTINYERQDDSEQSVRVFGDTAVITAKLYAEGTEDGKPFEYSLWFSDTYSRTPAGWKYVFGQASSRLPQTP